MASVSTEYARAKKRTLIAVNLANAIDRADGALLPSVYTQLGCDLGLGPAQLGAVTSARSILSAFAAPVWGYLCDRYSRVKLLALGCLLWGVVTVFVGRAQTYTEIMVFRSINGVALGVLAPAVLSIVADYIPPEERGTAYGWLGLTTMLGVIGGTVFATSVSSYTILGTAGWRFAFYTVACISILLGAVVVMIGKDPVRGGAEYDNASSRKRSSSADSVSSHDIALAPVALQPPPVSAVPQHRRSSGSGTPLSEASMDRTSVSEANENGDRTQPQQGENYIAWQDGEMNDLDTSTPHVAPVGFNWRHALTVVTSNRSFILLVLGGTFGGIPWSSLNFLVFWFQFFMTDVESSISFSVIALGAAAGNLIGGKIADRAQHRLPHGRIASAQLGMLIGIPTVIIILIAVPRTSSYLPLFILLGAISGFHVSWMDVGCIYPLVSDVVLPEMRSTAFSFLALTVIAIGACGTLLVGELAEKAFGFVAEERSASCASGDNAPEMDPVVRENNMHALANALLCMITIPWTIEVLLLFLVMKTHPKDSKRVRDTVKSRVLSQRKADMELQEIHHAPGGRPAAYKAPATPPRTTTTTTTTTATGRVTDTCLEDVDPDTASGQAIPPTPSTHASGQVGGRPSSGPGRDTAPLLLDD